MIEGVRRKLIIRQKTNTHISWKWTRIALAIRDDDKIVNDNDELDKNK